MIAAQDPVTIPNPEYISLIDERLPIDTSRVYFYVEDEGEAILCGRISRHAPAIREAFRRHKEMCARFDALENALAQQHRNTVAAITEELTRDIEAYSNFVAHLEQDFLLYPSYRGGNMDVVESAEREVVFREDDNLVELLDENRRKGAAIVRSTPFNPSKDFTGLQRELSYVPALLDVFAQGQRETITKIYDGMESDSYRGRLELVRMLFRVHLAFDVEESHG